MSNDDALAAADIATIAGARLVEVRAADGAGDGLKAASGNRPSFPPRRLCQRWRRARSDL
jgi:hypothetical protein